MDLRFNRACGAMVGLTFGHSIAADTIGDPIEESTSISERILTLLTADDSNGNPVEASFGGSHNRSYDLIISAIKAGIATPTSNLQTFSNAVWDYCALSDMTLPRRGNAHPGRQPCGFLGVVWLMEPGTRRAGNNAQSSEHGMRD